MHRVVICVALAGCHTRTRVQTTTPGESRSQILADRVRALPATVALGDDGRLRFVAPLRCAADVMVEVETGETEKVEANLATFVVGVIVTAAGAVGLASGLA